MFPSFASLPVRSLVRLVSAMTRAERIALLALSVILLGSFLMLLRTFYVQHTEIVPREGGTYIEGAVGELVPLNPWYVTGNDVNRDITSLIFGGLMAYNPITKTVDNDLATVTVSRDYRVYTATLKEGILWHDSTKESPHPVTSDDVMFTFSTIQNPAFGNPLLQQNFRGVTITKIDDRTVRFTLEKPYVFFVSNLTLGLLPQASFASVPVEQLKDALVDFGIHPIGAGRYAFQGVLQTELSTEVTLKRFDQPGFPIGHIERIVVRIFDDYTALLTDIGNMDGVRLAVRNENGLPILPKHFRPLTYTLPQYVGLFFNLERPIPADPNVRLGLQRGTNKQAIVDTIHETNVIDTPLLEIDPGDWRYSFDAAAAQGAFFASSWNLPEKIRLQKLLEQREANDVGPLRNVQPIVFLGTGGQLALTGSTKNIHLPLRINGFLASTGVTLPSGEQATLSGSWMAVIPAGTGMSGSLAPGANTLRLTDAKGDIIDTAYITRYVRMDDYRRANEERRIVDEFLASKQRSTDDPQRIAAEHLTLDRGFLRRKKSTDPVPTRIGPGGKPLTLTLLTSPSPESYGIVAKELQKQWGALGAAVTIDIPASKKEFEEKLLRREYDVVLFGQSLLDNLDSYPYWHSSQMQDMSDPAKLKLDAFNLSQYASFDADLLLSRIRDTGDARARASSLSKLRELLAKDVPAIVLYSPLYVTAINERRVHGVTIDHLALHADRLRTIGAWYVTTGRTFRPGYGWLSFLPWLVGLSHEE